jgi:hypothetical protein
MSSRRRLWGYAWVPLSLCTGWAAFEGARTYRRAYDAVRFADKNVGVEHDHPSVDQAKMRAAGALTGLAAFAATFFGARHLLLRALLAKKPDPKRVLDRLSQEDLPPPLTLAKAWGMLGPGASSSTYNAFARQYGLSATCTVMAAMWAVAVAPVAHAKAEAAFAPVNPETAAVWGREMRERKLKKAAEAQALKEAAEAEKRATRREALEAEEEKERERRGAAMPQQGSRPPSFSPGAAALAGPPVGEGKAGGAGR